MSFAPSANHEAVLAARQQAIIHEDDTRPTQKPTHWPEDETKIIDALIFKHHETLGPQAIAELYLKEYVLKKGDWHPTEEVVVRKVKKEKAKMKGSA
ncbi:hypothetical protein HK097_002161 [Rhizophlyctis rosea]|uniref:Uncharacterized protein n=1 Tax=Rhizophlyctis rosea TaxID=64517 RepID=A0AAD5S5P1_9FUNG|nr:hypothetical protein HK097_002161 [Rhizophlyctis rosea]